MTPRLDDIRRDDELLDALGSRAVSTSGEGSVDLAAGDRLVALLNDWTRSIDRTAQPEAALRPVGRYARSNQRRGVVRRAALVSGAALTALSISSVSAAVSGTSVPMLRELGGVTRGLVGADPLPESVRATGVMEKETAHPSGGDAGGISQASDPDDAAPQRSDGTTAVRNSGAGGVPTASTTPSPGSTEATSSDGATWVRTQTGWVRTPVIGGPRRTSTDSAPIAGRATRSPSHSVAPASTATADPTSTANASEPVSSTRSGTPRTKPKSTRPTTQSTATTTVTTTVTTSITTSVSTATASSDGPRRTPNGGKGTGKVKSERTKDVKSERTKKVNPVLPLPPRMIPPAGDTASAASTSPSSTP